MVDNNKIDIFVKEFRRDMNRLLIRVTIMVALGIGFIYYCIIPVS